MSHGGEMFALGEGASTAEPGFELHFRGYARVQVDRYVNQVEQLILNLTNERDEAYAQIQVLDASVQQLQQQIVALRRQLATDTPVSFRQLGPRVEHILALAEEQADEIRAAAVHELAAQRAEAERVLIEARERTEQANRDFELALAARRREEDRAADDRRAALEAEIAKAQQYASQVRTEADALLRSAEEEARRTAESSAAHLEQARAQAETQLQNLRAQLDREYAERRAATQRDCHALRVDAE